MNAVYCDYSEGELGEGCPYRATNFLKVQDGVKVRYVKSCERHMSSMRLLTNQASVTIVEHISEADYMVWAVMEK